MIEIFLRKEKTEDIPPFIPPSLLRIGKNINCIIVEGVLYIFYEICDKYFNCGINPLSNDIGIDKFNLIKLVEKVQN